MLNQILLFYAYGAVVFFLASLFAVLADVAEFKRDMPGLFVGGAVQSAARTVGALAAASVVWPASLFVVLR